VLTKLLTGLQVIQLLILIGVFVWVGWDKELVLAEKERLSLQTQKRTTDLDVRERELSVKLKQLSVDREGYEKAVAEERAQSQKERERHERALADLTIQLNKVQQETLRQLSESARRSELYALGTELVKIVSSQQQCLTEDQYFIVDFVADLFNKNSPVEFDSAHLQALARGRKGCEKSIAAPVTGSLLTGFVVLGAAEYDCAEVADEESKDSVEDEAEQKEDDTKQRCKIKDFKNFSVKEGLDNIEDLLDMSDQKGAIVQAKRDTNIRANKHDYGLRNNPIIGKLPASECAEIQELYYARGNMWARVHLSKCP
jgi:hypothetical protein